MSWDEFKMANVVCWLLMGTAIVLLMLTGCTTTRYVPVEYKSIETVTINDTVVEVRLDIIRDSVVTPDTLNCLENRYARSYAEVHGGLLHHSLSIKDIALPVRIQYVEKEKMVEVDKPYPVEVVRYVEKELTRWQRYKMDAGGVLIGVIVGLCGVIVWVMWRARKGWR